MPLQDCRANDDGNCVEHCPLVDRTDALEVYFKLVFT